jgi:hypothetical protein
MDTPWTRDFFNRTGMQNLNYNLCPKKSQTTARKTANGFTLVNILGATTKCHLKTACKIIFKILCAVFRLNVLSCSKPKE